MKFNDYLQTNYKTGDIVWVCDYRFNNRMVEKPIRHIKPTKVIVCSNGDLPKNKRVYYSNVHFKPLNKKGLPIKSKVIAPYDNTGFRSYAGVALEVFLNKEECFSHYREVIENLKWSFVDRKRRLSLSF